MLRARLFGGLAVWIDGRRVADFAGARPRSLLAYLLIHPGRHPRSRLAGLFWPDVLESSARGSLRSALWCVRSGLVDAGGGRYLACDRLRVGIDPDLPRLVDMEQFDRLLAAGDPDSLRAATALGSHPLLVDLDDEWVAAARDHVRARLITALETCAAELEAAGDLAAAIDLTRDAVAHDPLREESQRALMRRLDASGQPGAAVAAYRRCRETLAREIAMPPALQTSALAEDIRRGRNGAGAARSASGGAAAPAGDDDATIGHDRERSRLLAAWLRARDTGGGVALLVGDRGLGKSHLARWLGARVEREGGRATWGCPLDVAGAPDRGAWEDVFRRLVPRTRPPPPPTPWAHDLARLCPAVETSWGHRPSPARAGDDARLFEAVSEALTWCASDAPLLVVLDDLNRADAATLALLAHASMTLADVRVLVVATLTPGWGPACDTALDAIRRRGDEPPEIELRPLPDSQVHRIVASRLPGLGRRDVAEAVARGAGNPGAAMRVARGIAEGRSTNV